MCARGLRKKGKKNTSAPRVRSHRAATTGCPRAVFRARRPGRRRRAARCRCRFWRVPSSGGHGHRSSVGRGVREGVRVAEVTLAARRPRRVRPTLCAQSARIRSESRGERHRRDAAINNILPRAHARRPIAENPTAATRVNLLLRVHRPVRVT